MTAGYLLFDKINIYDTIKAQSIFGCPDGYCITVGGYNSRPRLGVMLMQYVTYENLFAFSLVIIATVELTMLILQHKKK